MAIELHIFTNDSRIPSRDAWQREIERLSFPTVLDSSLDVQKNTGFTPTTYQGKAAGFEFCWEPAANVLSEYPHVASKVSGRDMCATFRWGGDMTECAAASSAAAALAKITDGVYFYPDDDLIYNADEAVDATRKDLS
jgi:hypothetical protein